MLVYEEEWESVNHLTSCSINVNFPLKLLGLTVKLVASHDESLPFLEKVPINYQGRIIVIIYGPLFCTCHCFFVDTWDHSTSHFTCCPEPSEQDINLPEGQISDPILVIRSHLMPTSL